MAERTCRNHTARNRHGNEHYARVWSPWWAGVSLGDGRVARTFGYYFHIKKLNAAATWRRGGAVGLGAEWMGGWAVDVGQLCAVCGGSAAYFKINARGGCRGAAGWGKYQGERGENQLWSLKLSKHRNNNSSSSNNTSSKSSSFCASQKGYGYTKQN